MKVSRKDRQKIDEYKIDDTLTEYILDNEFGSIDIPNFIDYLPKNYNYSDFILVNDDGRCSSDSITKFKNIILNGDIREGIDKFCFIVWDKNEQIHICYEFGYNILSVTKSTQLDTFNEDEFAQYFDDIVGQNKKKEMSR